MTKIQKFHKDIGVKYWRTWGDSGFFEQFWLQVLFMRIVINSVY